jgi:ribosomal-protein-alanine acetyltransferase
MMRKILFICTGNTCRSPMAEALAKNLTGRDDLYISRGLSVPFSDSASFNTIEVLREKGIDISSHISRPLTAEDLDWCDRIAVMTDSHKEFLLSIGIKKKITVLGISDPYGQDKPAYKKCFEEIKNAIIPLIFGVNLEIMSEKHIKKAAEIEKECFSAPWTEEGFLEFLENNTSVGVCLTGNGELKAYINGTNVEGYSEIYNVAVEKESRGKGFGYLLLKLFEAEVYSPETEISLEVRKSNTPAIRLYEKSGFKKVGERKNFYQSPTEDAYVYIKRTEAN